MKITTEKDAIEFLEAALQFVSVKAEEGLNYVSDQTPAGREARRIFDQILRHSSKALFKISAGSRLREAAPAKPRKG